MLLNNPEYSGV